MIHVPAEAARNTKNVVVSEAPFVVPGFTVGAVASQMRYRDRLDLALILAEDEAVASGVFTRNRFCAAPVLLCKEHLQRGVSRGILVNAGYANACTGEEGLARAKRMASMAGRRLRVPEESILVASTGIIGPQINLEPVEAALPELIQRLSPEGWEDVSRAIMTTDTVPKLASAVVDVAGRKVTVGGVAKGAGMIAPDMATLLVFVCTDVLITREVLDHWVRVAAEHSFNAITVDGDTSTNDTLLVLAGGSAGNPVLCDIESRESLAFGQGLQAVLLELARKVVLDGEGATKFIEIHVSSAEDRESARKVAMTIANSPLVKTAFFGEDANWGRIVAATGRAGVELDPARVTLHFDDVCVFRAGVPLLSPEVEENASRVFRQSTIRVQLDLGQGDADYTAFTCDLSYDYVKINASYRT